MTVNSSAGDVSRLRIRREDRDVYQSAGPSRPRRWWLWGLLGVVVVAGLLITRSVLTRPVEVEIVTAAMTFPSQSSSLLTASGYVVAQQKAAVASKGTGRLVYLGVEEGDHVRRNQVLARLEDQDVVAALDRARADLQVARAEEEDATRGFDRQKSLFDRGLASQADLDAARSRITRIRAGILSAQAGVREAEVALENTRIRAPFDGTVLTKDADVGEVVAPFAAAASSRGAVVTIADMKSLQVEADVNESNITKVHPGAPCEIVLDAYPTTRYAGSVHKIVPTADRSKATVLTKVAFRNRDDRVLPEMSAKVTFLPEGADTVKESGAVLTLSSAAVTERNGTPVVFLVKEGKVTETRVRVGRQWGSRTEILAGMAVGEQAVLHPEPSLSTGASVQPKR